MILNGTTEVATATADESFLFAATVTLQPASYSLTARQTVNGQQSDESAALSFAVEAAANAPGETPDAGGCGCTHGPDRSSWILGALLPLALLARRRRAA